MNEADWSSADAWTKGGAPGQVFVYGQGWVDAPDAPQTEWGIRFSNGQIDPRSSEEYARLIVSEYPDAVVVSRTVTAWVETP